MMTAEAIKVIQAARATLFARRTLLVSFEPNSCEASSSIDSLTARDKNLAEERETSTSRQHGEV
jgi:hypothetical protein